MPRSSGSTWSEWVGRGVVRSGEAQANTCCGITPGWLSLGSVALCLCRASIPSTSCLSSLRTAGCSSPHTSLRTLRVIGCWTTRSWWNSGSCSPKPWAVDPEVRQDSRSRSLHIRAGSTVELLGNALAALLVNLLGFGFVSRCLGCAELGCEGLAGFVLGHGSSGKMSSESKGNRSS
jgi:hypothetical protein